MKKLIKDIDAMFNDRGDDYGDMHKMAETVSSLWSGYLSARTKIEGHDEHSTIITGQDFLRMMAMLKWCREFNKHKDDNLLDAAVYSTMAEAHGRYVSDK